MKTVYDKLRHIDPKVLDRVWNHFQRGSELAEGILLQPYIYEKRRFISDYFKRMENKMKTLLVLVHYNQDDVRFLRDYSDIEIFYEDKLIAVYGSFDSECGDLETAKGFVAGFKFGKKELDIRFEKVADRDF